VINLSILLWKIVATMDRRLTIGLQQQQRGGGKELAIDQSFLLCKTSNQGGQEAMEDKRLMIGLK